MCLCVDIQTKLCVMPLDSFLIKYILQKQLKCLNEEYKQLYTKSFDPLKKLFLFSPFQSRDFNKNYLLLTMKYTKVSQKFCNIWNYFAFQDFKHLFTRLNTWRFQSRVLCEGPNSVNNIQVLVFDCYLIISSKASSSTSVSLPDLGLSLRLVLPSWNKRTSFVSHIPGPFTSLISFVASYVFSPFFSLVL